jgi:hypothetical protein
MPPAATQGQPMKILLFEAACTWSHPQQDGDELKTTDGVAEPSLFAGFDHEALRIIAQPPGNRRHFV